MRFSASTRGWWRPNLLLASGLVLLSFANLAFAADKSWSGASSTTWNTGANWVGNSAPSSGDNAVFNGTFSNQPNVTGSTTVGGLWMTGSVGQNVTISGAFTLTLAGNTINGTANLGILVDNANAFTLTINAPLKLGNSAQTWTNNSANVLTIGSGGVDNNKRNLTINGTGNTTVSGVVSNTGDMVKSGTGTLILSGSNTYSGLTTIIAGVLNIENANALGTTGNGTTVSSGAELQIQGGIAVGAEALTLNGSGTSNTGALRNISGNNSWSGNLALGSASTIAADSGTLTLSGTLTDGGFALTVTGAANITENGVISGTGALIKNGTGTLTLAATNTYSGGSVINAGTVVVNSAASLGATSGVLTLNAGTLEVSTGFTTTRNITLGNAASTFQIDPSQTYTVSGVGSGTGTLNKTGPGTMILGGVNTFSGGTNVIAGTLQMSLLNQLLNTGTVTVSGGTFDLQAFNQAVGAVTLTSGSIIGTGVLTGSSYDLQSGTVSAILAGVVGLTKSTSGTVTLSGANTYTGSTTISAGTLQVNTNNALGAVLNGTTVSSGAALKLNNVNYSTAEALILNGTGISNGGALTNSGTSTFAGAINIATNSYISANGGTLNLTGGIAKNGTTLTFIGGGTVNIMTNGITGSSPNSDLVVDGTTVVLDTANSYNGPTTVQNSGTLKLGASNVLPSSPQTALTVNTSSAFDMASYDDGVASLTGDSTATVKNSVVSTTSTLTINPGTGVSTTFAGVIAGTNGGAQGNIALLKTGLGTLVLTGANTFSGSTTISNGTLTAAATSGSALGSTSSITVNSGGALLLGASNQINDSATISLSGGTFAKGNFSEGGVSAVGLGALTLTTSTSHIDFGTGTVGVLCFASFSPAAHVLTIDDWTGIADTVGSVSTDRLIFNSDQSGNLSDFSFTGFSGAVEFALAGGFYEVVPMTAAVPEPSTFLGGILALVALGRRERRRLRKFLRF